MSDIEVKVLFRAIACNDIRAFKRFYYLFYKRLHIFAKSFLVSDEEAEEIVNDVLLSVWNNRVKYAELDNALGYLYTSLKHQAIKYGKRAVPYSGYLELEHIQFITDNAATPEERLFCEDLNRQLTSYLSTVPDNAREIFKLVKYDGLKYREVAEILNVSVKTVEYHMGKMLKHLTESFEKSRKLPSAKNN